MNVSTAGEAPVDGSTWRRSLAIFALLFVAAFATVRDYGLTWDESYYFRSQDEQRGWWRLLGEDPGRAIRREEIERGWHRRPYDNSHPPFYKIVSVALAVAVRDLPDPISAYRLAPCLLFALTGLALDRILRRTRPRAEATLAVALWATTPAVFGHAHFAATDTPISAFAVLATWAFLAARERPSRAILLGAVLGAAVATKFTGLLLPAPLACWSLLGADRRGLRALLWAAPVALLTAVVFVPYWWHDPVGGIQAHLGFSLGRDHLAPISVAFAGEVYGFAAPWYLPLAGIAVATPLTLWAPALIAGLRSLSDRRREEFLVLLAAVIPIASFMIPPAPKHDGVRLFLHAFPFLAALAARSWLALGRALAKKLAAMRPSATRLARVLPVVPALLAVVAQATTVARYHPFELSYYNLAIGGLPGAAARGMEITFWIEAVTPEVRADLDRLLPPGASVSSTFVDPTYFHYLQEKGYLRRDVAWSRSLDAPYQLVVSRVSHLRTSTMAKLAALPTVYERSLMEVPLVRLFYFPDGPRVAGQAPPAPPAP